jgi:hypothetical protein
MCIRKGDCAVDFCTYARHKNDYVNVHSWKVSGKAVKVFFLSRKALTRGQRSMKSFPPSPYPPEAQQSISMIMSENSCRALPKPRFYAFPQIELSSANEMSIVFLDDKIVEMEF